VTLTAQGAISSEENDLHYFVFRLSLYFQVGFEEDSVSCITFKTNERAADLFSVVTSFGFGNYWKRRDSARR
jgi:hypothetical protein